MSPRPRILVVTTKFPWPRTGACEQDCSRGVEDFLRLGFDVRLLTKYRPSQAGLLAEVGKRLGIEIVGFPFSSDMRLGLGERLRRWIRRFAYPLYLDGAAFEFATPDIAAAFARELDGFRPDLAWLECSYVWPLARIAKRAGVPVVTRSANMEYRHFLGETGRVPFKRLRCLVKKRSELAMVRASDLVLAITPKERDEYRSMGARTELLPLRSLPEKAGERHVAADRAPLEVFFAASTYAVLHNARAAEELLRNIIPLVRAAYPGRFRFSILGRGFPEALRPLLGPDTAAKGYVDDLEAFLRGMDIALAPSLSGEGMQQKIFEPLMRGFPTVTQARGLAGYPFFDGEHLLLAETPDAYVRALGRLLDRGERERIGSSARIRAAELFSQERIDAATMRAVESLACSTDASPT